MALPLPTGAARSACAVVGHSTVWELRVTHESSCAPEESKKGRMSQSKYVLENPELSLDMPLSKIITT